MKQVDYDTVAPTFDLRYGRSRYEEVERALARFIDQVSPHTSVLEIGCGTGHWLTRLPDVVHTIAGVDRSLAMLERARSAAPRALLVRATAEQLPFAPASFDAAFCINALHHFPDKTAFLRDCRRVLRDGGAFFTVGLDPHTTLDQWWVYDHFPAALTADRERYPPTEWIRDALVDAGFVSPRTEVAQHVPSMRPFDRALEQGFLDRHSTSQLMLISDAEYDAGMRRLLEERPVLRADLRLYGTSARAG